MADENMKKNGGISVETEHIFPIIKKWLYSEKEIFLRELVSNASDAVTKLRRLASLGQYEADTDAYRITVSFNKSDKTITVTDNGIGMTADEVERYICNMALSGAVEFIQKYEGEQESGDGIIGHFGLGFYSSFMVADRVDILTKSYTDAPAVFWTCTEEGNYEIEAGDRDAHGTSIVMHISADGEEYLSEYKLREILERYCSFMPTEIYLVDEEKEEEPKKDGEAGAETPINDTHPLWQKNPSDCTEEEYKAFYQKVFNDYKDPLFYMHINADYPLNFKGILYFPRIRDQYESLEGKVKLYYNQVFVADNIKEVIPEYLLMLRGVLDCPELPLNVSRSYLQNSGYVSKISAHIIKKVADKLNSLFNQQRERFEEIWKDIRTFVEYGCMCDRKFYDRVEKSLLFALVGGGFMTKEEYLAEAKEKHEGKVYYATDEKLQAQYIAMYEAKGIKVVLFDSILDTRFAESVERYADGVKFIRVDAETDALKGDGEAENAEAIVTLFEKVANDGVKLTVRAEVLADETVPAILNISEDARRMEEMMKMYMPDNPSPMPSEATLIVNTKNPIVKRLSDGGYGEKADAVAKQIYSLALVSQRPLSADEMKRFLKDSYEFLSMLS